MKTKHPSYCCQKCGELIGWIGRVMPFHKCKEKNMNPLPRYNEKGELDTRLRVDPVTGDVGIGTPKENMNNSSQRFIDGLDKTTKEGFAEALLIAISNVKNKDGLLVSLTLGDTFEEHIEYLKQVAEMMVKEKNNAV